jgi:23S rRNA (uracil1939-C5)-methyltransferase
LADSAVKALINVGQKLELNIYALAYGGEGIAKQNGMVIFVAETLPGDRVQVVVQTVKKRFARAKVLVLLEPSPDRVEPVCPQSGICGGCTWLNLRYAAQLKAKFSFVENTLSHVGRLKGLTVLPLLEAKPNLGYRHKIQIPIQNHNQELRAGFYTRQTHAVVEFEECCVQPELGNTIFKKTLALAKTFGYSGYDEATHQGQLRHLIIRLGAATQEALLTVVTTVKKLPRADEFAQAICQAIPEVVGVVQNVNPEKTNVITGSEYKTLVGRSYLYEIIRDLKYQISAESFFQVNPFQLSHLAEAVMQAGAVTQNDIVLDVYCGVGFLSLEMAKKVKQVFGIEVTGQAIEDAKVNKALNGLTNVDFYALEASQGIQQLRQQGVRPDLIVLDPPRKGCDPKLLHQVLESKVPRLVYVSCNPVTLARDLAQLVQGGYQVQQVQPVDLFPHTYHVESVVGLTLKNK